MAPKKHSGFMMYVTEFRKKKPEGQRMSLSQAIDYCGSIWKGMTDQQRGPYISGAKNADVASRARRDTLNCHGEVIAAREKEERDAAKEIGSMKRNIDRMVREGRNRCDLENTKFIFATFNYFVRGLNSQIYIPAEFSACQFSLKRGVNSLYSTMIDPGHLIFGLACDAMKHSGGTHRLPLPPLALGEPIMSKLYQSIQDYLRSRLDRGDQDLKSLPVFTKTDDITMVKSCFHFIKTGCEEEQRKHEGNYDEDEDRFYKVDVSKFLPIVVYDVQYLFLALKKEAMDVGGLTSEKPNLYVTDAFFSRDFYEFQDGISCQYHEEIDRSKYCTQSRVNRWAYTFCDYMCADLAITMLPGKHMPPSYKSATVQAKFNSDASVDSFFSLATAPSSTLNRKDREERSPSPTISTASSLTSINSIPAPKVPNTASPKKFQENPTIWGGTLKHYGVLLKETKDRFILKYDKAIDDFSDDDFNVTINDMSWSRP
ncbi:protein maelstrom 1 [Drosophila tropicalis]|uniref:protein maelstrom 1 n=1 Tax=Drosophila tropicalis TaxID=46794 RepID=UPI0035AC15D3